MLTNEKEETAQKKEELKYSLPHTKISCTAEELFFMAKEGTITDLDDLSELEAILRSKKEGKADKACYVRAIREEALDHNSAAWNIGTLKKNILDRRNSDVIRIIQGGLDVLMQVRREQGTVIIDLKEAGIGRHASAAVEVQQFLKYTKYDLQDVVDRIFLCAPCI